MAGVERFVSRGGCLKNKSCTQHAKRRTISATLWPTRRGSVFSASQTVTDHGQVLLVLHLLLCLMSMIVADPASRMLAQVASTSTVSSPPQQGPQIPQNGRCRVLSFCRRKLPALRPAACIMSSMHTTAKREAQRVLEADFALRTAGTFQIDLLPADRCKKLLRRPQAKYLSFSLLPIAA